MISDPHKSILVPKHVRIICELANLQVRLLGCQA